MPGTSKTLAEGLLNEYMNKGTRGVATCTQNPVFLSIIACLQRAQREETGGNPSSPQCVSLAPSSYISESLTQNFRVQHPQGLSSSYDPRVQELTEDLAGVLLCILPRKLK